MMKLTCLLFCVAVATAAVVQPAVESASINSESDLEGAQTHHKHYSKGGGVYVGAFPGGFQGGYPGGFQGGYPGGFQGGYPGGFQGYPGAYPSAYPYPGYGGSAYGYPYRPYQAFGVGVYHG